MKNKKVQVLLFILLIVVQLYVPLQMILKQEDVVKTGTEFKFQTAPVDPYDAFRGKYITLFFKEREITVKNASKWMIGETVYATIRTNKDGFAQIISISRNKPTAENCYVKSKIAFTIDQNKIALDLPFNRFYMNENSASDAEKIYRDLSLNKKDQTYALVAIKNGEAVIKDVRINEVSIKDLANKK